MNFVLICVDTLRYDHLSCHGNEWIKTPNLQSFAEDSIVFDNAYAGSLMTIPMRTDVIRGRFGQPFHPWLPLGFDWPTLPRVLSDAGWTGMLVCDTPHLINGAHGFDWPFHAWHFERGSEVDLHMIDDSEISHGKYWPYDPAHEQRTLYNYLRNNRTRVREEDWQVARTLSFAGDCIERNKERDKLFLWVDTFEPHEPWSPPDKYIALYDDPGFDRDGQMTGFEPVEILDDNELRHVRAHYAAEVSLTDEHIGRFLDRLAATGRDRDTTVIVTSDHGTNLGAHGVLGKGPPFFEQVAHEVLLVRSPGLAPGRRAGIVQPAELMPTILDLAGVDTPDSCQGASLVPVLATDKNTGRNVAVTGSSKVGYGVAVQDERWCLIDYVEKEKRQLYDKKVDRKEEKNVIGELPRETEQLHRELVQWLRRHDAHPGLVEAYETGVVGPDDEYFPVPDFLKNFEPYWKHML